MRLLHLFSIIFIGFGQFVYASENDMVFGANPHLDELFATLQSPEGAKAEADVLLAFRKSGSDAMDLLLARGYEALKSGAINDAIWHFSALIDHAPDFAEAYAGRAAAFYQRGEIGLAIADMHSALALNPRHFVVLFGFGYIQEELGHDSKALAAYRLAFSLNPHFEGLAEAIERVEFRVSILH